MQHWNGDLKLKLFLSWNLDIYAGDYQNTESYMPRDVITHIYIDV